MDISIYLQRFPELVQELEAALASEELDEDIIDTVLNKATAMFVDIEWRAKGEDAEQFDPLEDDIIKYAELVDKITELGLDVELRHMPERTNYGGNVPYIE